MNTYYSINKFANQFKVEYPEESSISIFFSVNDAKSFTTQFGEQTNINPFYIVAGSEKINHDKIKEVFGNDEPVYITFSPTENKKLSKRDSFMKLTIDLSRKYNYTTKDSPKNGTKLSYYKWSIKKYVNDSLSQLYDEYKTQSDKDDMEDITFE